MAFPTTTYTDNESAASGFVSNAATALLDLSGLNPIAQLQSVVANLLLGDPTTVNIPAGDVLAGTFGANKSGGADTGTYTFPGALAVTGAITATAQAVTAASPSANVIGIDGTVTLNRAGGTIDGGAHSFYPVRGQIVVTATTTVKEAFAFGVRAGATISGVITETSATRIGALFAKLDVSAATLTSGQVSVAWFDWGATATTPASAECNVIRVQNTTAAVINSLIYGYGKATYLLDVSDNAGGWFTATAPTSLAKGLKVNVNGTTYYIGLYSAAS